MGESDANDQLDRAFLALADPVRRSIIARLSRGPATVNELAEPFDITVQAVSKHIAVLEQAGLVTRTRDAQRRPVHLDPAALERLTAWIDPPRVFVAERTTTFRQSSRWQRPRSAGTPRNRTRPSFAGSTSRIPWAACRR